MAQKPKPHFGGILPKNDIELIQEMAVLEDTMRQVYSIDRDFYLELLQDYAVHIAALNLAGDSYPLDRAIELEQKTVIEARLPNITDAEFDDYTVTIDLLGILYD